MRVLRHSLNRRPAVELSVVLILPLVVAAVLAAHILGVEATTRAALHGLCAQRPSHSFWLGERRLPFDARMTGIYGSALSTVIWLSVRRPPRRAGAPGTLPSLLLAGGVLALAVDGGNALAEDLALPTLYEPSNTVRFLTGSWTGIALGTVLAWVFHATTWPTELRSPLPVIRLSRDGVPLTVLPIGLGILVTQGPAWLYAPLAIGLVVAAFVVLTLFAWPVILMLTDRIERAKDWSDLWPAALMASTTALAVMALTSSLRFLLERALGLPALP